MLVHKAKKNNANALMIEARRKFYHYFIEVYGSNQRCLFSAAKKLLNQGDNRAMYPPVDDNIKLANQLGTFFIQKSETIGSQLDNMAQGLLYLRVDHASVSPPRLSNFSPPNGGVRFASSSTAAQNKKEKKKRTCTLDPMPTSLVIDCIDVLLPIITKMVNSSLESALFANDWKCALVLRPTQKLQPCKQPAVCFKAD